MQDSIVGIAIVTFFIVLGVSSGTYYLIRAARGRINLDLQKKSFYPGEMIEGSFTVKTRRLIKSERLVVKIYCIEGVKPPKRFLYFNRRPSQHRYIYREEMVVEPARIYQAKTSTDYSFQMKAPDVGDPADNGTFWGPYIAEVLSNISHGNRVLLWHLEVRLEISGVDIAKTNKIEIEIDPDILI